MAQKVKLFKVKSVVNKIKNSMDWLKNLKKKSQRENDYIRNSHNKIPQMQEDKNREI